MVNRKIIHQEFGEQLAKETPRWEARLGRLLNQSRKNKKNPEEAYFFVCVWWIDATANSLTENVNNESLNSVIRFSTAT